MARKVGMKIRRFARRMRNTVSISTVINSFNAFIARPFALITLMMGLLIMVSVKTNANDNVLTSLEKTVANNTALKPTATWIKTNSDKTIGSLFLTSAVFAGAPASSQLIFVLAVTLFTTLTPKATLYDYGAQTVVLFILLKIKKPIIRITLLGLAAALFASEKFLVHLK